MEDYGIFTNIMANAGTIVAMTAAISLAWRGRTKWEPSEDDVPKAPQKVAGLLSAVAIVGIWTSLQEPGHISVLLRLSLWLSLAALISLCIYVFLVSTLTYEQVIAIGEESFDKRNIIGGFRLSEHARHIIKEHRSHKKVPPTKDDLFKAAAYQPHLVWTRASRSLAKVFCILSYIGLIAAGTVALASAAILVDIRTKIPKVSSTSSFHIRPLSNFPYECTDLVNTRSISVRTPVKA